jgi:alanyl-tRNA synthetase
VKASSIRARFLSWFAEHGHAVVPSASLIPHNDPTLFFVNAGMVQFKDVFTGADPRDYTRAASVQKCLRVSGKHNDLENVGRTPRHHTFFEMLGNFSFGDYFKADAIPFAWSFLTGEMGLDPNRLWVTVFEEDDEAWDLWRSIGFPEARLQRLGAKDNFWSMGDTGPCGPCTEIHYDHGPAVSSDTRGPAGGSDRYVEIWNLVFMQYDQAADGSRTLLPRPSIDTGMGLERLAAVKQGVFSNYDTDLFSGLIQRGAELAGVRYGASDDADTALRVMADHARATAFLVADGVMPSNEGRGYVLRRVMRRAIRFGVKVGLDRPFFHELTARVVTDFGEAHPELEERRSFVHEVVAAEEERFRRTLDRGMKLLSAHLDDAGRGGTLPGEVAFTLSDTFGFPLDLTELIAAEAGVGVDGAGFETSLAAQKAKGRAAWKGSGEVAVSGRWRELAERHGATAFTGYATTQGAGEVVALFSRDEAGLTEVERLQAGQRGVVVLDRTPFYGESGGQVGDAGTLAGDGAAATVRDVQKQSGLHLHEVEVTSGALALLHAALRAVLGDHVTQKGSLVGPDRLRFDLSHHKPITPDELLAIEDLVNARILDNTPLSTRVMALEEATAAGAMALFGEKYDAEVRVVEVPGFSLELCGGTHVGATGDIGLFKIVGESGVAAGVRRVEAQTGHGAIAVVRAADAVLRDAAALLKAEPARLVEAVERLRAERREAERRADALQAELARAAAGDLVQGAIEAGGVKVLAARVEGDLKAAADQLRDQLVSAVVVLGRADDGKALLLVAATADVGARVHCGRIVQAHAGLIGGRGGGRPDMAQAGGDDPSGLDAALAAARDAVVAALS